MDGSQYHGRLLRMLAVGGVALVVLIVGGAPAEARIATPPADSTTCSGESRLQSPPPSVFDSSVEGGASNTCQQGFNELQEVTLTNALRVDGNNRFIPAGTIVDSHMIFLNPEDCVPPEPGQTCTTDTVNDFGRVWTFSGRVLGVMSDNGGVLEAESNAVLGLDDTEYPPPFTGRGLEGRNGTGRRGDGYRVGTGRNDVEHLNENQLRVGMSASNQGDWIRVVTLHRYLIDSQIQIRQGGTGAPLGVIDLADSTYINVEILSTDTFHAPAIIDRATACFGDAEQAAERDCTAGTSELRDVNGDELIDLVLPFQPGQTGIDVGDTEACLTARSYGLTFAVKGCASITLVP